MLSYRPCWVSTLALIAVLSTGSLLSNSSISGAQEGPRTTARLSTVRTAGELTGGDRLKVTFFEHMSLAPNVPAGKRDASPLGGEMQTFYQRLDLSGEYTVEQDGSISVPLLGRFVMDGKSLADAQSELAVSFARVMNHTADVSVSVVERAPVYIVGPVKQPGAYKFAPGMMVLQVLALAGGLDRNISGTAELIEGVRETERIRKSSDQMKRLLARRARLEAEHDGLTEISPPATLVALAGEQESKEYLGLETAMLQVSLHQRQQQRRDADVAIKAAKREVDGLQRKLTRLDALRDMREERLADLQKVFAKGFVSRNTVMVLRAELADAESRRQDLLLGIAQAEDRLERAEQTFSRNAIESEAKLLALIATTEDDISNARQTLSSTALLHTIIDESSAKLTRMSASSAPTYQIVRTGRMGTEVLAAQETTSMRPGDVLKVVLPTQLQRTHGGERPERIEASLKSEQRE